MSTFVSDVLKTVSRGESLDAVTAEAFMNELMSGNITPVQTAAVLAAMTVRGEKVSEIVGFAKAMRAHAKRLNVPFDVVDTCGTGGDGANTFNISTAAAFVCAAAGVPIAKHGNRAVSSKSGSADVLEALGVCTDLDDTAALQCLLDTNLCFLFAPTYHPAMKHAAEPRKQLGFRTIFNILGPLTNPAQAKRQVLGVFRPDLVRTVASALIELGSEHVLVVHGAGGIDEFSLQGETLVAEVRDGQIREYIFTPEMAGLSPAPITELVGGDAAVNANVLMEIFAGERGPRREVVVLNAGAALYVGGKAQSIRDGVALAEQVLDAGAVLELTNKFISQTQLMRRTEVVSG